MLARRVLLRPRIPHPGQSIMTKNELLFVIIAACIPRSKPVWDFHIKRKPIGVSNSNSGYDLWSKSSYRLVPDKISAYGGSRCQTNALRKSPMMERIHCV
ncbi:hypothetical protein M752DRAFT_29016 [Aspergillus phoenicis ATCC 13157]|uniref:Uncharacterized protein n=1 Tax=Aspergillus phoenicis ATCC 13157 TaxID=1353007 RepID=A0A370PHM0_ASPPH|nr:hypothetical protein M752DRAFT_29016 [Aspergillus phoenicis ATCC 13157]